jgi:hypothetical protein
MKKRQLKELRKLLSRAVNLQAERWDIELKMEGVIGDELCNSEDFIKELVFAVDAGRYTYKATNQDVRELIADKELA